MHNISYPCWGETSSRDLSEGSQGYSRQIGTKGTIFLVWQLQEKNLARNKFLYLEFIDLEKAVNRLPCQMLWWTTRKLRVDEWIIQVGHRQWPIYSYCHWYCNMRSKVQNCFSDSFSINAVRQDSVHIPLFIIMFLELNCEEALSQKLAKDY